MTADLDALWRTYHRQLFAFLYTQIHDGHEAEDMVSCVYLRALVAISNGHEPHGNERAWLYTIARSVMADDWRYKHRGRRQSCDSLDDYAEQSSGHDTHDMALCKMTGDKVRRAISRLNHMQETVSEMRLEGYAFSEIGEAIGTAEGAAKALHWRANNNLRVSLQEEMAS